MSPELLSLSPDLRRLRDQGYDIEARAGHLLMHGVPYVGPDRQVRLGTLACPLDLEGDATKPPESHVAYFTGDHPCDQHGSPLRALVNPIDEHELLLGVRVKCSFSSKPASGRYSDFHEKMTTYARILSHPAQSIDPTVTPMTFPIIRAEEESVFQYEDTASSRAGIAAVSAKLAGWKIGIVGLGGTGSYVLDLVAKTPVAEIHLFDGDRFSQHNAFRSPGAPSVAELQAAPSKVAHFHAIYSRMHRHVVPHEACVDAANAGDLRGLDFAFLCLDRGAAKRLAVEALEEAGIPFIDVGMGVELRRGTLMGILRVTTSTPEQRDHFRTRVPFPDDDQEDEYDRNIQIADLNALNAALAVVKWKKLYGFYLDHEREHHSTYTVSGNMLTSDHQACPD